MATVALVAAGVACGQEETRLRAEFPRLELDASGPVPLLEGEVVELAPLFGDDAQLSGVAVDPETGTIYVLDARRGVYELEGDQARLAFDLAASADRPRAPRLEDPPEMADLALTRIGGEPSLVMTAENDGFIVRLGEDLLYRYFCYLPRVSEPEPDLAAPLSVSQQMRRQGVEVVERAEAVAVDPDTFTVYAQPRTLRLPEREPVGSELFLFDPMGGSEPIGARVITSTDFAAGGMLVADPDRLLLGGGGDLFEAGPESERLVRVARVDATITGLAMDAEAGEVVVLDGAARRLIRVDYSAIPRAPGPEVALPDGPSFF